ncbi:tetratricopeptide repeat protein [Deinococcus sp. HMF7604]|uniref:tetratricopeptide repeat protein n=1 Tax=Deinococcus betulae TaxID=2873312 RepID=UPI001CD025F4|nr:tetratricopeptide repeat protein [Deinococcus betulae]MBZ9751660.1 tetratricopeptide repeat protein [Deinococcus betulae]
MLPLPAALLARLSAAAGGVVAPVEVGGNQAGLVAWAQATGRQVSEEVPVNGTGAWLWLPRRRSDLERLPVDSPAPLLLSGSEVLVSVGEWQAALPGQTPAQAAATFRAFGGWPGALPLARAFPGEPHAPLHPQAHALLAPWCPPPQLRAAATRLACADLVTPAVAEALGVAQTDFEALLDGGWLWPEPAGGRFPAALRQWLAPLPAPEAVRCAAQALSAGGHHPAALDTLAAGACWPEYLERLAQTARSAEGEATLRARFQVLPDLWRAEPTALYVAGLLARAARDLDSAQELYTRALPGLSTPLAALAWNARGVVRALSGEVQGALDDFDQAARQPGLSAGEANHNRATLLVQLGRHAEAERSLNAAVAAFREAGDPRREAQSLETLGTLHFGRGLLRDALAPLRTALTLLRADHPAQATLALLNLAECHALLGEVAAAQDLLQEAALVQAADPDPRALGWLRRLRALLALQGGEPRQALALLDLAGAEDPSLQAEMALLQVRAWRELGQPDMARAALDRARPLGLRADLESALLGDESLDSVINAARQEEARLELASALLRRAQPDDLREALALIQAHGYLPLLASAAAAPLAALAHDEATRALFPLHLQALGPLRLTHAGRQLGLADFPTRKSAALLVALALSERPQPRELLAERFWPGAKNPLASLQTAVYHLRSAFSVPVVASERGLLSLLFPVRSDVEELRCALHARDLGRLTELLRPFTAAQSVLPELVTELTEEREQAERVLHDALRLHAAAQPGDDVRRRDALRALITADPYDTASREALIRWHEDRGEQPHAQQERDGLRATLLTLGLED